MARDYKHSKRSGAGGVSAQSSFAIGLTLGLAVAIAVYVYDHRPNAIVVARTGAPLRNEKPKGEDATPPPQSAQTDAQYDFYDVLPKFEVIVPKTDNKKGANTSAGAIDTPGSYVLQVGSWRNFSDADRVRAQLALQGVESSIQKVTVDNDTWHRVRIGPINNLNKLEETRRKLREGQIDAMVIRLGKT
jgi:cell division protein FtsN